MKLYKNPCVIAAFICAILLYSGIIVPVCRNQFRSLLSLENISSVQGYIKNIPSKTSSGNYYKVICSTDKVTGLVNGFSVKSASYGDLTVYVPAVFVEAFFPGKLYSEAKNKTDELFFLDYGEKVSFTGNIIENDNSFSFFAKDIHLLKAGNCFFSYLHLQFKKLMYQWGSAGALFLALLTASKEYLDNVIINSFRDAGLSHILALSGFHLSFLSSGILLFSKRTIGKKYSGLLLILFQIFFLFFVGITPSLFRAFLFSIVLIFASFVHVKNANRIAILSFVFLLHCCIFPSHIYTISFILSYAATFGILIFFDIYNRFLIRYMPALISSPLAVSCSAQSVASIVAAFFFKTFPVFSVFASLVISPFIEAFLSLGIFAFIVSLCLPFLSSLFGVIMQMVANVIFTIVYFFSSLPIINF
ncbi:MAG: ComEC/Rec2 family competence protein [Treponema sp.]|nr:ComEC/Rec2 family competence protein [Treponema sp.]